MGTQRPKAILFDLDDTILAYDALAEPCWRQVCSKLMHNIHGLQVDDLLASIMETRDWYWSDLDRNRRGRLNLTVARREIVSAALTSLGIYDQVVANAPETEHGFFVVPKVIE